MGTGLLTLAVVTAQVASSFIGAFSHEQHPLRLIEQRSENVDLGRGVAVARPNSSRSSS
jgi:hypothetical protein